MVQTFVPSYSLDPRAASPVSYISNPMAVADTSGWATYADAAGTTPVDGTGGSPSVTLARTLASVLRGSTSFLLTKDAVNRQGQGVSTDFTIDAADKATVLQVNFDYNASSGMVVGPSSDISVWIYDVTNAVLIPVAPYQLQGNGANNFNFKGIFQTNPNSTSYRLIFHIATTNATAWTLLFDNIAVGPQVRLFGAPVEDWKDYTPATPNNVTLGNGTMIGAYRRIGDSMQIRHKLLFGSTTTVNSFYQIENGLPAGFSPDFSKMIPTDNNITLGCAIVHDQSPVTNYNGSVMKDTSGGGKIYVVTNGINVVTTGVPITFAVSDAISVDMLIPVTGWSSTVQMSNDTDTRVVACRAYQSANQTITAGGGFVDLQFNLVNLDTHGAFNTSTFSYVVPVSGVYQLYCQTLQTANVNGVVNIDFVKNGTPISEVDFLLPNAATATTQVAFRTVRCVAGDILKVQYRDSGVGNATIFGTSPDVSYFEISRLSGPSAIAATETVAARYKTSAGQSIPTTTFQLVNFDTAEFDSHGAVTTGASWKFTAPVSGVYHVSSLVTWDNLSFTLGNDTEMRLFKNGSLYTGLDIRVIDATQTFYRNVHGDTLIRLLAGDFIHIICYQNTGGNRTLIADGVFNWISINRVGNY